MRVFGLIGYPLGHSFSAGWFRDMFAAEGITDAEYRNFPLEDIGTLPSLIENIPGLRGFNVTAPYKEQVIPYLDELSPDAAAIGAVNCVTVCTERGIRKLYGHNTDWLGFRQSLEELIGTNRPEALILGSGGAAKAAAYALRSISIRHVTVSTSKSGEGYIGYGDISPELLASHRLIINATPLGTYPDTDRLPPLPYSMLDSGHFLLDMVYNPPLTRFLAEGQAHGCAIANGAQMLHNQARLSWELFKTI